MVYDLSHGQVNTLTTEGNKELMESATGPNFSCDSVISTIKTLK